MGRHCIPQNLIWSWGLFFLVNSPKTNTTTPHHPPQQPNKKQTHTQTTTNQTRKTQINTHTTESSHCNYSSLPSDYCILQGNSLVLRKKYFMFISPSWGPSIIFHFVQCWMTRFSCETDSSSSQIFLSGLRCTTDSNDFNCFSQTG